MAALLPLAAMAIPALFGAITGGINIANAIKGRGVRGAHRRRGGRIRIAKRHHKARGGRTVVRRHHRKGRGGRVHMRRHHKGRGGAVPIAAIQRIMSLAPYSGLIKQAMKGRGGRVHAGKRGKGVFADFLGSIPLLGSIAGPIVRALGGRLRRKRGHGLAPMYMRRPYVGMGMLGPVGSQYNTLSKSVLTPSLLYKTLYKTIPEGKVPGKQIMSPAGLLTMAKDASYIPATHVLNQLLHKPNAFAQPMSPVGSGYRKGHLRKVPGRKQRVRVRPALVGRGLLRPAGGYVPYHGRY